MRLPIVRTAVVLSGLALGACNVDWSDDEALDAAIEDSTMTDGGPHEESPDARVADQPDAQTPDGAAPDAAPPVACTGNDDCDDQDPCNGVETCKDHFCAAGTAACPNPDADHCSALCLPAGDSVSCKVVAKDADGDRHGDPLCSLSEMTGDDCDDHASTVYPSAAELCDGLDNDCDGKVDLEDGLSLSSNSKKYVDAATKPDVTWVPPKSYYATSFALGSGVVGFNELDRGGERIFSTSIKLSEAVTGWTAYSTAIFWGGDELAVGWTRHDESFVVRELRFQRLDANGGAIGTVLNPAPTDWSSFGGGLSLGRIGTNDWLVFFNCCNSRPGVSARRISPQGELREPMYTVGAGGTREQMRSVVAGDQIGTTWVHGDQSQGPALVMKVRWTRRDAELTKLDVGDNVVTSTEEYSVPGGINSVITDTPDGYLIGWFDGKTQIAEFDREGVLTCGPTDLGPSFPAGSFASFNPSDAASGPHGVALVATGKIADDKNQVDIVHVKPGCKYVQRFTVGESTNATNQARIAGAGDDGFAVVWQESTSSQPVYSSVYNRVMDPTFCKQP